MRKLIILIFQALLLSLPGHAQRQVTPQLKSISQELNGSQTYKVSSEGKVRFTCRGDSVVYAIIEHWDGKPLSLQALNLETIDSVTNMNDGQPVEFLHTPDGLLINAQTPRVSNATTYFRIKLKHRRRVLFIGDSITDGGWGRSGGSMAPSDQRNQKDRNHLLGHGYVEMCAAHFQSIYPERDYDFLNRGISGNTLGDMQQRWQQDGLDLHPDVVSILIGTNDADAFLRDTTRTVFDYQQWEQTYRRLLDQLRLQNPQTRIILGTPFVAKVGRIGRMANFSERQAVVARLASIVRTIAKDYHATLVPFDELFAELQAPHLRSDYWIWDGIHPTTAGHRRMADLWIKHIDSK